MYAGKVVEKGVVKKVLTNPEHPYTKGLIECVPHLVSNPPKTRKALTEIPGVVPALTELGKGCAFAPRCNEVVAKCKAQQPTLSETERNHLTSCWVAQKEIA